MTEANSTALSARHLRWLDRVTIMPQPADPAGREALRNGGIQRPLGFSEFRHFCNHVAIRYGRFGTNMWPSVATMAKSFSEFRESTVSGTTVKRWLAAAVELGMFERVREATRTSPAVYQIAEFWNRPIAPAGSGQLVVVEADQTAEEAARWVA